MVSIAGTLQAGNEVISDDSAVRNARPPQSPGDDHRLPCGMPQGLDGGERVVLVRQPEGELLGKHHVIDEFQQFIEAVDVVAFKIGDDRDAAIPRNPAARIWASTL